MSAHAAHNDAHDDAHDAHDGPHVTPLPIYFAVFGTLLVLTGVTVWIAQFDFGSANTLIAMLVATVKATLVAAIFMHLLYEERLNALAFVFGLLFVSLFFIFTMLDVFTRKHVDPVRANGGVEASDVAALRLEAEAAAKAVPAPVLIDEAAVPDDERSAAAPPSAPVPAVATDAPAVMLGMRMQGHRLVLSGTVASEDVLQKVLSAAKTAVGEPNVASLIRVDDKVATPDWIGALGGAFSGIKGVRGLGLEATASKVILTGRADSDAVKAQAGLALAAQFKPMAVDNRIMVKPAGDEALDRVKALTQGVDGATYFGENASELNASAHSTLNSLGDMLFEVPGVGIQIGSHADARGGENKALAQTRADAIVAYLVKLGIDPARLKGLGFGPGKAGDASAQNRRIEYVVLGADGKPYSREMIVALEGDKIVIYESVYFETGKAVIKAESLPVLTKVAAIFKSQQQIKKVEIQGHTDASGDAGKNKALSQQRAEAVRTFLMGQGVEGERLTAIGYGQEKPLAPNETEAGRNANRRVEFKILAQ